MLRGMGQELKVLQKDHEIMILQALNFSKWEMVSQINLGVVKLFELTEMPIEW